MRFPSGIDPPVARIDVSAVVTSSSGFLGIETWLGGSFLGWIGEGNPEGIWGSDRSGKCETKKARKETNGLFRKLLSHSHHPSVSKILNY